MAKTKKTERSVRLGDRAYSFYDASTGIGLAKGEVIKLTARQLASVKIRKALHTGHLQYAAEVDEKKPLYNEDDVQTMVDKFNSMVEQGMTSKKIAKAFSKEQIDLIAKEFDLTRDEGESNENVIESILASTKEGE